jgi:hypothetical protein
MRWDQGRAVIDRMLADQQLQRVPPSREHADLLMAQARTHLSSASEICDALRPFDRMRRQRHDAEYPPGNSPALAAVDVREDIPKAAAITDLAERVLDQMSPF